MTIYAIGDIHGHLGKLQLAHALIAADRRETGAAEAPVIHLGDLVDRGPDSCGVIQHLMDGMARGENWIVLKGNHDRMFAGFMADPAYQDSVLRAELAWLHPALGGRNTLASYGVSSAPFEEPEAVHAEALARVPAEHLDFIETLPLWHEMGEAVFVHAGIRPGVPMVDQVEDDLVWIRDPFLMESADHGALIVHGHTAIDQATHYGNRLNIDSSAAFGGPLSAVAIEGREAWLLTADGRLPLPPVA